MPQDAPTQSTLLGLLSTAPAAKPQPRQEAGPSAERAQRGVAERYALYKHLAEPFGAHPPDPEKP